MADDTQNARDDRAPGPTYKSLFLGACLVIGSAFGWWFTNFISSVDALIARVAVLEIGHTEHKWTFKINAEKIDSHEERLQRLEREHAEHRPEIKRKDRP